MLKREIDMASFSTVESHVSLTRNSPSNCKCVSSIPMESYSDSDSKAQLTKYRLSKGHALIRKQLQRQEIVQYQKTFSRRRFTFSGHQDKVICKKRRRFTSVALPTKFLLGGNITDPLNLRSLEDEKINQQLNAFTPESSPMPLSRHRTQVQVLIPPNIYDPLNLNTGEDIEFNLFSAKPRKRRRHRKNRREEQESAIDASVKHISDCDSLTAPVVKNTLCLSVEEAFEKEIKPIQINTSLSEERVVSDKIVSPVVPQGSPAKFYKRFHSRSFSKEIDEKTPVNKLVTKRRRSKGKLPLNSEAVKFRPNAERFSYGNHITNLQNWKYTVGMEDQRFRFFNKELFQGKDVLDIGCNTGQVTLHIGKYLEPNKILGIDIDKRLIDIAQRNLRRHISESIAKKKDFPKCLSVMYGPLSKLTITDLESRKFPNNVSFIELNYIPTCDEHLEGQKEEFDVILCLRVTKWIHLNWGDEGLKMAFKRMFAQLHAGGHLILEAQPWFTYSSKKKITPAIYKNYCGIELKPDKFCDYLLSKEVGFSRCEFIGQTVNCFKGYRQPVYLLTKGFSFNPPYEQSVQMDVLSPMSYLPAQWHHQTVEQGSCSVWQDGEMLSNYLDDNLAHN